MERLYTNNGDYLVAFETREQAQEYVKVLDSAIYYLRHGEVGRPAYKVRKIRNTPYFGIYVKYNFFYGTFNAPKDGFLITD